MIVSDREIQITSKGLKQMTNRELELFEIDSTEIEIAELEAIDSIYHGILDDEN